MAKLTRMGKEELYQHKGKYQHFPPYLQRRLLSAGPWGTLSLISEAVKSLVSGLTVTMLSN